MHHRLTLNLGKGLAARDLQPNARTKHRLQTIIHYPPLHLLSDDEKSLILQFRYYLSRNKHALPKFLECVHWGPKQEVDEALELLCRWQSLDPADALELLAPRFLEGVDPKVRKYTISRLQCADNEELLLQSLTSMSSTELFKLDRSTESIKLESLLRVESLVSVLAHCYHPPPHLYRYRCSPPPQSFQWKTQLHCPLLLPHTAVPHLCVHGCRG